MKLLVLGASGAVGQWVTRLAVARGHEVNVVLRPESPYQPPDGVGVTRGQVTDASVVEPPIRSAEAVISCLGLRRRSVFPWSALMSPPVLVERVSKIVATSADNTSLRRFVWISAGGVGDSRANTTRLVRAMISAGNVGVAYEDLERAEQVLSESVVPSLAVRPVTLINGPTTGRAGQVGRYGILSTVRRSDVAQWMLDVADATQTYSGNRVLLGTTK